MVFKKTISDYKPIAGEIFIFLVIFLFSFPRIEPFFDVGLDSSYSWALNHLFNSDFGRLKELIFPVGPLGFMKMPATGGNSLMLFLLLFSALKLCFIILFYRVSTAASQASKSFAVLLTFVASYFADVDFSIIGSVVLLLCLYRKRNSLWFFIAASGMASLGLFIKSSIGISAFSAIFIALVIDWYLNKKIKKTALIILASAITLIVLWVLIFWNITSLFYYLKHVFYLSKDYGSALSLFPDNNWYLLGGFILSVLLFPFVIRDKEIRITYLILIVPLFFMWKHSMSREDIYHNSILLYFMIIFWGIIIANATRKSFLLFAFPAVALLFYYGNMSNLPMYSGYTVEVSGITNFVDPVFNYQKYTEKYNTIAANNFSKNKVDDQTRKLIGNATVDIYPWELSYIPANNFNWQPRKTLQSGSYSHWLDLQNSKCFERTTGPEFVLLHLNDDKWGGKLGSIDGRYLLNDEPLSVYTLLNNYSIVKKSAAFLLFRKSARDNLKPPADLNSIELKWNDWTNVPEGKGAVIRAKVAVSGTLLGGITSFFYKGDVYYIDYMMDDDRILTYRFIPSNAADGLWINPFVANPANDEIESSVKKIRFRNAASSLSAETVIITWQKIQTSIAGSDTSGNTSTLALFGKANPGAAKLVVKKYMEFENAENANCTVAGFSYGGKYSNSVPKEGYSFTYALSLDSLWHDSTAQLLVETDLRYYLKNSSSAVLIIAAEKTKEDFWQSADLKNELGQKEWQYGFLAKTLDSSLHKSGMLKVYVWNTGKDTVYIDNFRLSIKEK